MVIKNKCCTAIYNDSAIAGATSKTLSASKPGEYRAVLTLKSNAATICEAVINLAGAPCKIYELDLSCQVPNNITLPNAVAAGVQLAGGDEFTAGDYTVVVTDIISGSPTGWKGKGYVKMKLVTGIVLKQISVNFENVVVNECYELASGSVVTDYDPNWGNILDVDDLFSTLDDYVALQAELNDFLQIFSGSPEDVAKLNTYKAKFHDLNSLIQNNGELDAQTKSDFQGEVDGLDDYIDCAGDESDGLNLRRTALPGICTFNPWAALAKCLGSAAIDVFLQYTTKWIELIVDGTPKNYLDFEGISGAMNFNQTLGSATMACGFSLIPIPNNKAAATLVAVGGVQGAIVGFSQNIIAQYNTLKNQYRIDQIVANIKFAPALQEAAKEGMIQVISMMITRKVSESPKVNKLISTLKSKIQTKGSSSVRITLLQAGLDMETINALFKKFNLDPYDYWKLAFQKLGKTTDHSRWLKENLIATGKILTSNFHAHHIVPWNHSNLDAAKCRLILQNAGIDINEATNGVFLAANSKYISAIAQTPHANVHTNVYFRAVYTRLSAVPLDEVRDELVQISKELLNGVFPYK